jgi:hypothetical protein
VCNTRGKEEFLRVLSGRPRFTPLLFYTKLRNKGALYFKYDLGFEV